MAKRQTAAAIAEWAEQKAKPRSPRKPTKRLTSEELGLMLKLRNDGLTQVQIAQRLDCDQKAVSNWLSKLTDTTDTAKSYLRGSALRMAQNIVHKGAAKDHVAALKGLSVLSDDSRQPIVVQVGVRSEGVQFLVSPPLAQATGEGE